MTDLASRAVGGRVVSCDDEFFAPASSLLEVAAPVFQPGTYTEAGKWMDGWETRRRRQPGHDSCIIALGVPGRVGAVTVDTSHFTGNYPERCSLDACGVGDDDRLDGAEWVELIAPTPLAGDSVQRIEVDGHHRVTHVRFNIYPDGGVARLRLDGEAVPGHEHVCPETAVDLASALVGGSVADASDVHYSPPDNLLRPTDPAGMWDGWETKRRRGPGNDWVSVRLGMAGTVSRLVVDTRHFKGNAPGWISLDISAEGEQWEEALGRHPVEPDTVASIALPEPAAAGFVRLNIHPDGGVARLRVIGQAHPEVAQAIRTTYLNALFGQEAVRFFHTACGSSRFVEGMLARRPYQSAGAIVEAATAELGDLEPEDWLEAFAVHPRIGERRADVAEPRQTPAAEAMSAAEQAGTEDASGPLLASLDAANRRYQEQFGFTFIVSAAGRTAEEMLTIVEERLANDPGTEIAVAAAEQRHITVRRLRSMVCMSQEEG